MKKLLYTIALSVLASAAVHAQSYHVNMDPSQEPGTPGTGIGSGSVILTGTVLTFDITFSGLSGNVLQAHFHNNVAGANGPIAYDLVPITTLGGKSGTIHGTIQLTDPKSYSNGSVHTLAQQLTELNSEAWYVNVHTTTKGGGEIRGQIIADPVPEPAIAGLLGLGLGAIALRRRNK